MPDIKYDFGISTSVDYSVPFEEQLKAFSSSGFTFIALGADSEHCGFQDDEGFRKKLDLAAHYNLHIDNAHVPFGDGYDLAHPGPGLRDKAVENTVDFLVRAASFGIGSAILHPHHYLEVEKEEALEFATASLRKIIARAPSDISLAIENLPDHRGSWLCERLLERFGPDEIGWCYDSSHENISGEPFHLLAKQVKRLTVTHLSDNKGTNDDHLVPGDGVIDWPKMKSNLRNNGKIRRLLFEVGTGEPLGEPLEKFVRRTRARAVEIFND